MSPDEERIVDRLIPLIKNEFKNSIVFANKTRIILETEDLEDIIIIEQLKKVVEKLGCDYEIYV